MYCAEIYLPDQLYTPPPHNGRQERLGIALSAVYENSTDFISYSRAPLVFPKIPTLIQTQTQMQMPTLVLLLL